MSDDQETIAPAELPTTEAAIEPAAVETEVPQDLPTEEITPEADGLEEETAPEIEYVTVERNGKQFTVPKELEGEFLMQADYTKKTQNVSSREKELDAREQRIAQQAEATEAELDARAELRSVSARLEEFGKLTQADWDYHHNQDPLGTDKAWRQFQFLKDQKADLEGKISTAQTERTQHAQQDLAKRVEETTAFAQKEIPGWKPELTDTLVKFAMDEGVPEDVLKAQWGPTLYKLLHRAHIGTLAMKQQAAPKPQAKPAPAPLATVKAASSPAASRSLGDIARSGDMEAYAKARAAGRTR